MQVEERENVCKSVCLHVFMCFYMLVCVILCDCLGKEVNCSHYIVIQKVLWKCLETDAF